MPSRQPAREFTRDSRRSSGRLEQTVAAKQSNSTRNGKTLEQAQRDVECPGAQKVTVEKKKLTEQAQQQAREDLRHPRLQDLKTQLAIAQTAGGGAAQ